jgi:hypothetical protein
VAELQERMKPYIQRVMQLTSAHRNEFRSFGVRH